MLEYNSNALLLDLGCSDGMWTKEYAKKIGTKFLHGIELDEKKAEAAKDNGVSVKMNDLNKKLQFDDKFFDVIIANQVIEHLYDTSLFLSEINRILKDDGYMIISTENAASWHNIFALTLGWQMFSSTNVCPQNGIGNPLALNRGTINNCKFMEHYRIFSLRGLIELLQFYEFDTVDILCSGYYPFPNSLSNFDKKHGHFISLKSKKSPRIPYLKIK